jgi:hypothetical protein
MFPVRFWGGTATRVRHGSQSVIAQIEAGQLEVTGRGRWPLITFRWRPHSRLAFSGHRRRSGVGNLQGREGGDRPRLRPLASCGPSYLVVAGP